MKKRLCVIVPYRDRLNHLEQFVPHISAELRREGIDDHLILVVEQEAGKSFNRAKLLNVGFDYVGREYDYVIFHDVDMLSVEADYSYCDVPTHLAARAEQFGWSLPYNTYFGGVTLFNRESFEKINGFSNMYESYGGEDDSLYSRCISMGIQPNRKNCSFRSLHHERIIDQKLYAKILDNLKNFYPREFDGTKIVEGLSTLEYKILSVSKESFLHPSSNDQASRFEKIMVSI